MVKKFWKGVSFLGAYLWERHGFWLDRENKIVQKDYSKLPLLGKIGYRLMYVGLKKSGF